MADPGLPEGGPEFGRIERDWPGETGFLICGGPSLAGFDFERLRGRGRILVTNSSYLTVPWADALVFVDPRWYDLHRQRDAFWAFPGARISICKWANDPRLLSMRRIAHAGLSRHPGRLMFGCTVTSTALNILALKGCSRIGVLGLDGKEGPGGVVHHHEPHPAEWQRIPGCFGNHGAELRSLAPQLRDYGVKVYNLNPASAHRMFEFLTVEQFMGLA